MKLKAEPAQIIERMAERFPEIPEALRRVNHRGWKPRRSLADEQAAVLYTLVRPYNKTSSRILEIGTAYGFSAAVLAEAAPLAHIVSLNPAANEVTEARKNLATYPAVDVVTAASWDYYKHYIGTGFDVILIDGDHNQIERDLAWWNKLRPGGLMLFHDYSPGGSPRPCPPVFDACNRFAQTLGLSQPEIVVRDRDDTGMAGFYKPDLSGGLTSYPEPYYNLMEAKPYSDHTNHYLRSLFDLAATVDTDGALVECGVKNGGSLFMLYAGILWRGNDPHVWAFGSPDGVGTVNPDKDGADVLQIAANSQWGTHDPNVTADLLNKAVPPNRRHYLPGWFHETFFSDHMLNYPLERIALLHIDACTYQDTREALERWYANVTTMGGLVILTGYGQYPGVRKALEAFLAYEPSFLFHFADTGVAWRKP